MCDGASHVSSPADFFAAGFITFLVSPIIPCMVRARPFSPLSRFYPLIVQCDVTMLLIYIHGWVKQVNKAKLPRPYTKLMRCPVITHDIKIFFQRFPQLEHICLYFGYYIFLQYWKYPYPDVFPLVFSIFVNLLFSRLGVPDQRRYWYPRSFMRASSASCPSAPLSQSCYHVLATPYSIFGSW